MLPCENSAEEAFMNASRDYLLPESFQLQLPAVDFCASIAKRQFRYRILRSIDQLSNLSDKQGQLFRICGGSGWIIALAVSNGGKCPEWLKRHRQNLGFGFNSEVVIVEAAIFVAA